MTRDFASGAMQSCLLAGIVSIFLEPRLVIGKSSSFAYNREGRIM